MNENAEKLKDLKEGLEGLEREHSDILAKEPLIAHPLHQAADEARRKFKQVTEGNDTRMLSGPHNGFVP